MSKGIFAEWLVAKMKENKLTAAYIAGQSGFHHNVIRNWMRGRSLPNSCSLIAVIDSLDKSSLQSWDDLMKEAAEILRVEGK